MLGKAFFLVFIHLSLIAPRIGFAAAEAKAAQEEWSPSSAGLVTAWTAPLCGKGKFVIQPYLFYNITRGVFNDQGRYQTLADSDKKYQYQEQLFIQYGLTDRLEIDAQGVYQQNYIKEGQLKAHDAGFGDSYLFLRYCAFEEKDWLPHITGVLQFKIPTGKFQNLDPNRLGADSMGATSGGGSWDPGFGLILTKRLRPFVLHADFACSFPQQVRIDGVKTRYADYLNYNAGVEYFLPKGFNLIFEINGFLQGDRKEDGARIPSSDINYLTIAPGIGWSNHTIQTLLAYQRVAIGTNTDANDSVVLTCVYSF